jgi:hypothetical protein
VLVERCPVMLGGMWSQVNVDLWAALAGPGQLVFSAIALVFCGAASVLLVPLLRNSREARFWALGMILALVPVAAAFPMNRLLLFAGIGFFGLMAMLTSEVGLLGENRRNGRPWIRRSVKMLLVLHGPVAVVLLMASLAFLPIFNLLFTAGARAAPRDAALADQSLVFVNGHEFPCVYTSIIRLTDPDSPAPRRIAILGPMTSPASVTREDDRTLVIASDDGWLFHPMDRLMRSADAPFTVDQRVEAADFEAVVRYVTGDGRPLTVAFEFRLPLDDPSYRWVRWRRGRLVSFPVPPVGGAIDLETESLLTLE